MERKKKVRRRLLAALLILTMGYAMLNAWGKSAFVTRTYTISDPRIGGKMRICLITDLHADSYGEGQSKLLDAIAEAKPDLVLLCGDIVHARGSIEHALTLLRALSGSYECRYILGNHEFRNGKDDVLEQIAACGIPICEGTSEVFSVGTAKVKLFCVSDIHFGKAAFSEQVREASRLITDDVFSILAVHRPNEIASYRALGFDLVLSGHTHGGQVRIPGFLNGLYAPEQGLFPKYAGGRYDFDDGTTMIVSRGLSKKPYWAARVSNPPELVLIDLNGAE